MPETACLEDEPMTMREKIARAMSASATNPDYWEVYLCLADAALAALEEPTEGMLNGARDWSRVFVGTPIGNAAATGCWRAMIAAAKEG